MPTFAVSVPHGLDRASATARMAGMMDRVRQKFPNQVSNIEESWEGNVMTFRFTTYGFPIQGKAFVEDAQVRLEGELPFAAAMFKGRIEASIRDEVVKILQDGS